MTTNSRSTKNFFLVPWCLIHAGCSFKNTRSHQSPKRSSAIAFLREAREHRAQFVFDVRVLDHVLPDAVEPRAGGVAAEPDLIASRRFADKRDLRHVRPRAAVRAAGRADDDFLAAQAELRRRVFRCGQSSRATCARIRRAPGRRWAGRGRPSKPRAARSPGFPSSRRARRAAR